MPTYILLQFDDDNEAYVFANDMCTYPDNPMLTPVQENSVHPKIWGIWRKPDKFCTCPDGKKDVRGFTRDRLYGWWVHAACRRPTARWASGSQWFTVLGQNLLPRSLRPYPEEMDKNSESKAVWSMLESSDETSH